MNDPIIRQFVERITASSKEAPNGTYYPTLVVGLGGTGLRVLRILKKRLAESDVNHVRLFGIDSDNSENEKYPNLPPLNQSELAILDAAVAVRCLERAAAGHRSDKPILDFLPNEYGPFKGLHQEVRDRITSQKGAGQLRRAGKLLFTSNVSGGANLNARILGLREQLTGLANTVGQIRQGFNIDPGVRIYVAGSIAGGTGAGCLLECLALLRSHFNTALDIITAFLVLPGPLFDRITYDPVLEREQTRGNSIGVLRELQPFLVGGMGEHPFVFDQHNNFQLGMSTLVNDVYLVDHNTLKGRVAKDNMDLYRSVSNFLYALVGSGVGASQAAGRVNGNITLVHKTNLHPRVYNAFGIAAVEYPKDDLLQYSVRSTLNAWLTNWLSKESAVVESFVRNFVNSLNIGNLDDLRKQLVPEVEEGATLTDEFKRNILKQSDEQFISRAHRRRTGLKNELDNQKNAIEQKTTGYIKGTNEQITAQVLIWLESGSAVAEIGIIHLSKHFKDLLAERENQYNKRDEDKEALEPKLTKKERWINILDFGLDWKVRKEYLNLTEQAMKIQVGDSLDQPIALTLKQIVAKIDELSNGIKNLQKEITHFLGENVNELNRIKGCIPESCFIQAILAPNQYSKWLEKNAVPIDTCDRLKGFTVADLLAAGLGQVFTKYVDIMKNLDIKTAALEDDSVMHGIIATNTTSEPLIHLIDTAPERTNMLPQKFVAGGFTDVNDPFIADHFPQVGQGGVQCLPTGDKHRVICVQTVTGFAAVHWKGFDVAECYYREKEWRYHTFPSFEDLPQLRPLSGDQAAALRNFGLSLVFELIASRGSNYYQNFIYHDPEKIHYYLLYKSDPNSGAAKLMAIQPPLIKPADKDKTKTDKKYLLGASLEDAFAKFKMNQSAAFVQALCELVEDFIVHFGKLQTKSLIEGFVVSDELVTQIKEAGQGTERRKILEAIRDALRAYATNLV